MTDTAVPRGPRAARRPLTIALLIALGLLLTALVITALGRSIANAAQSAAQEQPGNVAAGRALYGTACALCHGEQGVGLTEANGDVIGSPLAGVGTASVDFMLRTGRMPLEKPNTPLVRRPPQVTDQQRRDLIAYLGDIVAGGPGIPTLVTNSANLNLGREAFTTNCAACHGPTAAGIAVGQNDIAPNLRATQPIELAEAVRSGPGRMPVFSEEVLSDEDLNHVVAWVTDLRDRAAPGGIAIGRSGPVGEGFIAIVLGLGLLTGVMYLLGQKEPDIEVDVPDETPPAGGR